MTRRQIDASREARLWITQVLIPAFGVAMMFPECREIVVSKAKEIGDKFKKSIK